MAEPCYDIGVYLPGAFKGVAFQGVFEADSEHGRRQALGEFPFGERTAYLDLGRRIRKYRIRVRYSGNDHIERANELIAACESPGPGDLEHPTRGILQAGCMHCRVTDRPFEAAGETFLDIEFAEADPTWWLGGLISLVALDATAITTATETWFDSAFEIDGLPFYSVPAATAIVSALAGEIANSLLRVAGVDPVDNVHTIVADLQVIRDDQTAALADGAAWQVINNGLAAVRYYATNVAVASDEMRSVANWAARYRLSTDEAGPVQASVVAATRLVAASYIAKIAADREVKTLGEGLAEFDRVMTILDDEWTAAKAVCDDALMLAIDQFRVDAGRAILKRAYTLPGIVIYDFGGPVSSLSASYELYSDATKFTDLEALNIASFPWSLGPDVVASRA